VVNQIHKEGKNIAQTFVVRELIQGVGGMCREKNILKIQKHGMGMVDNLGLGQKFLLKDFLREIMVNVS